MKRLIVGMAALAAGAILAATPSQAAKFMDPGLAKTGSLIEDVACVTRRERVRRPGGRVEWRTVRTCRPDVRRGRDCRVVKERIRRPGGRVIVETRRICR
ncbi:hypothetical protein [Enterovirga sp. CN4-39]|uniref:hypothetical protein n=1 Tax=Enterovirga sp. CN4-39 TaxID=3400910 RepID=UPI003C0A3505